MSTIAHSSAMRTGWAKGATTTAVPIRTRRVSRASAAASTASDGAMPYGEKWCSASQTVWKPSSSARRHSSSVLA